MFFLVLLFEVLVLLYFVIEDVSHYGVEGFLAAVGFYLFDRCVEDRIFDFLGEAIAKRVFSGNVLNGADVCDVTE